MRTNLDEEFSKTKHHECLWGQIQKVISEAGIKISKQQVLNKWKNLKKKYRETIDANIKTGNQKMKGNMKKSLIIHLDRSRASTQAACTFDNGKME